MKKVYQTKFGTKGNCLHACIATILNVDLKEIPDIDGDIDEWEKRLELLQAYLIHKHGLFLLTSTVNDVESFTRNVYGSIVIVCGESSRDLKHAVLYKNGKLFHDPYPGNTGIKKVEECDMLVRYFLDKL